MALREMSERALVNRLELIETRLRSCGPKELPTWNKLHRSIIEELARRDVDAEEAKAAEA